MNDLDHDPELTARILREFERCHDASRPGANDRDVSLQHQAVSKGSRVDDQRFGSVNNCPRSLSTSPRNASSTGSSPCSGCSATPSA